MVAEPAVTSAPATDRRAPAGGMGRVLASTGPLKGKESVGESMEVGAVVEDDGVGPPERPQLLGPRGGQDGAGVDRPGPAVGAGREATVRGRVKPSSRPPSVTSYSPTPSKIRARRASDEPAGQVDQQAGLDGVPVIGKATVHDGEGAVGVERDRRRQREVGPEAVVDVRVVEQASTRTNGSPATTSSGVVTSVGTAQG